MLESKGIRFLEGLFLFCPFGLLFVLRCLAKNKTYLAHFKLEVGRRGLNQYILDYGGLL